MIGLCNESSGITSCETSRWSFIDPSGIRICFFTRVWRETREVSGPMSILSFSSFLSFNLPPCIYPIRSSPWPPVTARSYLDQQSTKPSLNESMTNDPQEPAGSTLLFPLKRIS